MEKIDLKKQYKDLYKPSAKKVSVVDVPPFQFAMIDGEIELGHLPGDSPSYQASLEALYGISYTLKFASKKHPKNPIDYPVMALEGLWWVAEGEFDIERPENWRYTSMMMQPDHISKDMFQVALQELKVKKPNPALDKVRFETFHEGLSMQVMHIGPYSQEPATLARMESFAAENGYVYRGKHHEIYLGDPRRAAPEKLKTVLRHPVEQVAP
jgi:hypothetical protein